LRNEKGIRCNTGAVPAAVSLNSPLLEKFFGTLRHCFNDGKAPKIGKPEDLPFAIFIIQSFRVKGMDGCNALQAPVFILLYP
jgi:hypothetical protein